VKEKCELKPDVSVSIRYLGQKVVL